MGKNSQRDWCWGKQKIGRPSCWESSSIGEWCIRLLGSTFNVRKYSRWSLIWKNDTSDQLDGVWTTKAQAGESYASWTIRRNIGIIKVIRARHAASVTINVTWNFQ